MGMKNNYSLSKPSTDKGFKAFSVLVVSAFLISMNAFATNYTASWTSVTPTSRCAGVSTTYTLVCISFDNGGSASSGSYIAAGKAINHYGRQH